MMLRDYSRLITPGSEITSGNTEGSCRVLEILAGSSVWKTSAILLESLILGLISHFTSKII